MRSPISFSDEPEVAEAQAQQAVDQMLDLAKHPGWQRIANAMTAEIQTRQRLLEASSRDDERHRGALEILRFIQEFPSQTIRLADRQLKQYRGN